jgi:hypothetical protein
MIKRLYHHAKNTSIKGLVIIGGAFGISLLPCSECGTPLILHIWLIAIPILVVGAMKKRYIQKNSTDPVNVTSD